MSISDLPWRLIAEESRSGPMNMALDEAGAESVANGADPVLRVYRWEPSTLSLGYHQDPATVDWEGCVARGVQVTRRPTGGGGIYHDRWGDISYSIIVPAAAVSGDLLESYHTLCTPVFGALEALDVPAAFSETAREGRYEPACYLREIHPAHDIVVGDRKLSGNAQYRTRDVVVQHGSITFESFPERHLSVFADPEVSVDEFEDRVASLADFGVNDRNIAVRALESALRDFGEAEPGAWSVGELRRARELAETKYGSAAWTRDRTDPTD